MPHINHHDKFVYFRLIIGYFHNIGQNCFFRLLETKKEMGQKLTHFPKKQCFDPFQFSMSSGELNCSEEKAATVLCITLGPIPTSWAGNQGNHQNFNPS